MSTKSFWVNGALCYTDGNRRQILKSIGENVFDYIDDFTNLSTDDTTGYANGWATTVVDVGASTSELIRSNVQNGIIKLEAADNEDDGIQMQRLGESFKLTANDPCSFMVRWSVDEATQSDFLIGLAITDTTLLASAPSDGVYMLKADGSTTLNGITNKNTTLTTTALGTIADGAWYKTGFYWDGSSRVTWFHNGSEIGYSITNIPDDEELAVSFAYLNGAAQADKGLFIDYVRCIQIKDAR